MKKPKVVSPSPDWRGEMLERFRMLIRAADPEVIEEVKWRKPSNPAGVPVWSHRGILFTGETYKSAVNMTFAKGDSLPIPPVCSIPASKATLGVPSISTKPT